MTYRLPRRPLLPAALAVAALLGVAAGPAHAQGRAASASAPSPAPAPAASIEAPSCSAAPAQQEGGRPRYDIAQVWTGVRTEMGAAMAPNGHLLVAYYDAERWLTLASLDPAKQQICRLRLPSRFAGWDAHNDISMAIGPDGSLHLVGNLHASKLFYAGGRADDLASVKPMPMTGQDEDKTTYPTFLRGPGDSLFFLYRSGGSGNGSWLVNRWQDGRWQRVQRIFADRDREGSASAYPAFAMAPDGTLHSVIVWRRTIDVASNYAVSYARSRDLRRWEGIATPPHAAPVGPDDIDRIETPGPRQGLMNNPRLVLAPDGTPVLLYPRQGADGKDAIVAARPQGNRWLVREIAHSARRTEVAGTGALSGMPSVGVVAEGWEADVTVNFPRQPRQVLRLDLRSLEAGAAPANARLAAPDQSRATPSDNASIALPQGLASARVGGQTVRQAGFDGPPQGRLSWFAQGAAGDRPRPCTTEAPLACNPPPSPLRWTPPAR